MYAPLGMFWRHGTNYVVAHKEGDPERALKEFHDIVEQEEEKGDWCVDLYYADIVVLSLYRGFKALKQSTKILFLELHRPEEALKTYTQLLSYTKSAVTRNYSEKTINGILDYVGGGKAGSFDVQTLERFYHPIVLNSFTISFLSTFSPFYHPRHSLSSSSSTLLKHQNGLSATAALSRPRSPSLRA